MKGSTQQRRDLRMPHNSQEKVPSNSESDTAGAMQRDGYTFYRSDNGVWLVDHVPPTYVQVLT